MKADAAVKCCPPTHRLGHPLLPRGVSEQELTLVCPTATPAGTFGREAGLWRSMAYTKPRYVTCAGANLPVLVASWCDSSPCWKSTRS